jgi:LmbE family N-acetylglucosaminyl deacetylase
MPEIDFIPYKATTKFPDGNVLILAPHPDDEIFACGGTIIHHLNQGHKVNVLVLTDGQAAISHDNEKNKQLYINKREQESYNAANILGCNNIEFWRIPDRQLIYNKDLVQRLINKIQELNIQRVYTTSILEIHPDHYSLAQIAIQAVTELYKKFNSNIDLVMYEIGVPLHPNILVDISEYIDKKKRAIRCFESQLNNQDYERHILGLQSYRAYTLAKDVKFVEAFYLINGERLNSNPMWKFGYTQQTFELEAAHALINDLRN